MSHRWRRSEEARAKDVRFDFKSKYEHTGKMSVIFRSDKTALFSFSDSQRSWSLLEEDELRILMGALMERFPLDALGGV